MLPSIIRIGEHGPKRNRRRLKRIGKLQVFPCWHWICICYNTHTSYSYYEHLLGKTSAEAKTDACCSSSEDIIELQDVRMSPIASLRNRQYTSSLHASGADSLDFAKFPPSFRITRNYGSTRCGVRYRGNKGLHILITFFSTGPFPIQLIQFDRFLLFAHSQSKSSSENVPCNSSWCDRIEKFAAQNQRCQYHR